MLFDSIRPVRYELQIIVRQVKKGLKSIQAYKMYPTSCKGLIFGLLTVFADLTYLIMIRTDYKYSRLIQFRTQTLYFMVRVQIDLVSITHFINSMS